MDFKKTNEDINALKHTERPERLKKDMMQRLSRIEGQIRGIARMVETDIYCDDILHQILSVESALAGVKKTLLEAHIKGCVLTKIRNGDSEVIEELIQTMGKMMK
jgi:DNA-binding FrmR family transcriptional regulator